MTFNQRFRGKTNGIMEGLRNANNGILPGLRAAPLVRNPDSQTRSSSTSRGLNDFCTIVTNSDGLSVANCNLCNQNPPKTTSVRGFGLHLKRAHLSEYNSLINVERVRKHWSEEEEWMLAYLEFDMFQDKGFVERYGINQALAEALGGTRSAEAIRKRRNGQSYKSKLQVLVDRLAATMVPTIDGEEPPAPSNESSTGVSLIDHLRNVYDELSNYPSSLSEGMRNLINKTLSGEVISDQELLDWVCSATGMRVRDSVESRGETTTSVEPPNRRENRRQRYTALQRLMKKDEKEAANIVLSDPVEQTIRADSEEVLEHFENVFGSPSIRMEDSEQASVLGELAPIWNHIDKSEILGNELQSGTAPGLDGVKASLWKKVDPKMRAAFYNVIMVRGNFPGILSKGRTVLIPKKAQGSLEPKDYRPITITSVISRQFSKILAGRLARLHRFDERQRAFLPVDGTAENLVALKSLIHLSKSRRRELHIASVDIKGAFDNVSHHAVLQEVSKLGAPKGFIDFLAFEYANMSTVLQYGGRTRSVSVKSGVRQGDPLSPLLFNIVLEGPLRDLRDHVGFRVDENTIINALVFADDTLLIASTVKGLQHNVDCLSESLQKCGMSLSPNKCDVLSLKPSGREKKVKVLTDPQISLNGETLRQIGVGTLWRYLGISFVGSLVEPAKQELTTLLDRITKAPLKPQQRMRMLKTYLLPKFTHSWVLGRIDTKTLKRFDTSVRQHIRKWLRLPHDCPVAFFHAPVAEGGLGVDLLEAHIPWLHFRRLKKLFETSVGDLKALFEHADIQGQLCRLEDRLRRHYGYVGIIDIHKTLADRLHSSTDGKDLQNCSKTSSSTAWVERDSRLISGGDYVHLIHTRIGCLPSKARLARGRVKDVSCRACRGAKETAYHVVQRCGRTHHGRLQRHEKICDILFKELKRDGWQVRKEPHLKVTNVRGGYDVRKPDLLCIRNDTLMMVDPHIVESSGMDNAYKHKKHKYLLKNVKAAVIERYGHFQHIECLPVTITWKGVVHSLSERGLKGMGVKKYVINQLARYALMGSYLSFSRFMSST